jgi:hypothetical protein
MTNELPVTYDQELAREVIRFGMFAADTEALKPRPVSRVPGPDGGPQGETAAEFTRRIVGKTITHLLDNGLLAIPEDARDRLDEGIPLSSI